MSAGLSTGGEMMSKYLVLGFIILAILPLAVLATDCCIDDCSWDGGCDGCNECDSCISHYERRCYNDDVYWYDSCGNREGRYESCDDYCYGGRCRDWDDDDYYYRHDWDDEEYHWYDWEYRRYYYYDSEGNLYYHYYNRPRDRWCDSFCNYPSYCAEKGYDGCGEVCYRQTDGKECGVNGVCSIGACVEENEDETKQEIVIQQMIPLTAYVAYQAPAQRAKPVLENFCMVIILAAGCIIAILLIGLLIGWAFRK